MAQLSHLAVAMMLIALALFVWRANPRNKTNERFALQTLLFALWVVGIGGLQTGAHLDLWASFVFAVASFIPVAVMAAIQALPSDARVVPRSVERIIWVLAIGFAVAATTTDLVVYETRIVAGELTRKTGPLYRPFALYFVAGWCVVLATL